MKRSIPWIIAGISVAFAFLPTLSLLIGIGLNVLWDCGVRDESGTVHGTCPEWQSDIVYMLMMLMWLSLWTLPVGILCALCAVVVGIVLAVRRRVKQP